MFIVIFALIIAILILNSLFNENALKGLSYQLKLNKSIAEINEEITLYSSISNGKAIPLDFVCLYECYPSNVKIIDSSVKSETDLYGEKDFVIKNSIALSNSFCMKVRSKNTFLRKIYLDKRGRYVFHSAYVKVGDFLGVKELIKEFYIYKEIIILPKRLFSKELNKIIGGIIGDISVKRFIFEDPVLTLGYREYTGREPMKAISWSQSAKSNSLIVKKYDYTTEMNVAIVLNTQCIRSSINTISISQYESTERAISIARVVCEQVDKISVPYSFTTNAMISGGRRTRLSLRNGYGPGHLNTILESLGRIGNDIVEPISKTLNDAKLNRQNGQTTVVITAEMFNELSLALDELKKFGNVFVIDASKIEEDCYEQAL